MKKYVTDLLHYITIGTAFLCTIDQFMGQSVSPPISKYDLWTLFTTAGIPVYERLECQKK